MIQHTNQVWAPGKRVKVGFMRLTVRAARPTPGDYAPDAYLLSSEDGTKYYEFVPHHGVRRLESRELREWEEEGAR